MVGHEETRPKGAGSPSSSYSLDAPGSWSRVLSARVRRLWSRATSGDGSSVMRLGGKAPDSLEYPTERRIA